MYYILLPGVLFELGNKVINSVIKLSFVCLQGRSFYTRTELLPLISYRLLNYVFQIEKVKFALSDEVLIIEDLISGHQDITQKLSSRTLVSCEDHFHLLECFTCCAALHGH